MVAGLVEGDGLKVIAQVLWLSTLVLGICFSIGFGAFMEELR